MLVIMRSSRNSISIVFVFLCLLSASFASAAVLKKDASPPAQASFTVLMSNAKQPLTGHLILVIARKNDPEPRFQVQEQYTSAQAFGVDTTNLAPGATLTIDTATLGYPLNSLKDVPAGDYYVQAVFNIYETYHLASGKTVLLPPDHGEGQHWFSKPGNFYNKPIKLHLDPAHPETIRLTLDQVIPALPDPAMTAAKAPAAKWLKYVRIRSAKLSAFWGRDMYLAAWVLLPDGFDEHPNAHYPLVVYQDHFHAGFRAPLPFDTTGPTLQMKGRQRTEAKLGYQFFQDWTNGRLPHVILISIQNANPYYDDSYVVDSANVGPYGSAITQELIPTIEQQYRGIGQGWARATFGGSTGGWEALASQVFYPDFYNGTWAACPDPVDFHAYQNVNLYSDANAFMRQADFGSIPIAADRRPDGTILANTGQEVRYEYVLGTHGRSGEQWNIWQAVFSPAGPDGYPQPVWNDMTGTIDKNVAKYWQQHWDLTAYLQANWPALGPKMEGKIHVQVGDGDTYFLNNAVHLLQAMLNNTRNPHSDAVFQYGAGDPHCYTGGPDQYTMQENNRTWLYRVLPPMVEHMKKTAPQGADVKSWIY